MPHLLNKERIEFRFLQDTPYKRHDNYSHTMIVPSFLASAVTHNFASPLEENRWWRKFLPKYPSISLVPNGPRGEHDERGHGMPIRVSVIGTLDPPLLDGFIKMSIGNVDVR